MSLKLLNQNGLDKPTYPLKQKLKNRTNKSNLNSKFLIQHNRKQLKLQHIQNIQQVFKKSLLMDDNRQNQHIIILPQLSSIWFLKQIHFLIQNCLSQTQTCKIYRVLDITTDKFKILKIVQISKAFYKQYQNVLRKANSFYNGQQIYSDKKKIIQYAVKSQNSSFQTKCWLYLIRPYFKDRNMYEEIHIHSKIPYHKSEIFIFVRKAIQLLNRDLGQSLFIPTLDNIYFDGLNLNLNCTSFETLLYLRKMIPSLTVQKFKHLYLLLDSKIQTIQNWKLMRNYMRQKMKVKAFCLMLFCFMTIRVPNLFQNQSIEQADLELQKLFDRKGKISNLILQLPSKWSKALNDPRNKASLKQYSLSIQQGRQSYFYDLFTRIFVNQQNLTWKSLLDDQTFSVILMVKISDQITKQLNKTPDEDKLVKLNQKTRALRNSFVKIWKFMLTNDPEVRQVCGQQKGRLLSYHFQIYMPLKLGLSLDNTLVYKNFFEIFYLQHGDLRNEVIKAAQKLKRYLDQNAQAMIKNCKTLTIDHITRVYFILSQRIQRNGVYNPVHSFLKQQMYSFIDEKRPFQKIITNARIQYDKIKESQILPNDLKAIYNQNEYPLQRYVLEGVLYQAQTASQSENFESSDKEYDRFKSALSIVQANIKQSFRSYEQNFKKR